MQEHSDFWHLLGPSNTLPNRTTYYQDWLYTNQENEWDFVKPLKDAFEDLTQLFAVIFSEERYPKSI